MESAEALQKLFPPSFIAGDVVGIDYMKQRGVIQSDVRYEGWQYELFEDHSCFYLIARQRTTDVGWKISDHGIPMSAPSGFFLLGISALRK